MAKNTKLIEAIHDSRLTLKYIAKQTGLTEQSIINMKNGTNTPKVDNAIKVVKVLDCKVEDIFDE